MARPPDPGTAMIYFPNCDRLQAGARVLAGVRRKSYGSELAHNSSVYFGLSSSLQGFWGGRPKAKEIIRLYCSLFRGCPFCSGQLFSQEINLYLP